MHYAVSDQMQWWKMHLYICSLQKKGNIPWGDLFYNPRPFFWIASSFKHPFSCNNIACTWESYSRTSWNNTVYFCMLCVKEGMSYWRWAVSAAGFILLCIKKGFIRSALKGGIINCALWSAGRKRIPRLYFNAEFHSDKTHCNNL